MIKYRYIFINLFVISLILLSGCSTFVDAHSQKKDMIEKYLSGNNEHVLEIINEKIPTHKDISFWEDVSSAIGTGDELMWRLELGSLYFHLEEYNKAIEQLNIAEALIEKYDQMAMINLRDVSSEGAALITNLNALPYRGLCRDRIAISIYKSLSYLGIGNEVAFRAQLNRLRDAQKKVMDDYQKFFEAEKAQVDAAKQQNKSVARNIKGKDSVNSISKNNGNKEFKKDWENIQKVANRGYGNFLNPMAIFFSGLGLVRDNNFENAKIDFQRLYEAMPDNKLAQKYYVTVLKNTRRDIPDLLKNIGEFDFQLNNNCVFLIFANGRSATLKEVAITSPVMAAWPMCEFYDSPYKYIDVLAENRIYRTDKIADMDAIIAQEFNERLPLIITRVVLSTAVKEAAKYAATYAAYQYDPLLGLTVYLGSALYTSAVNTADTRSWELLPKEFQITQFPMPRERKIKIRFNGSTIGEKTIDLPSQGGSAIVLVNAPSNKNISYHVFSLK